MPNETSSWVPPRPPDARWAPASDAPPSATPAPTNARQPRDVLVIRSSEAHLRRPEPPAPPTRTSPVPSPPPAVVRARSNAALLPAAIAAGVVMLGALCAGAYVAWSRVTVAFTNRLVVPVRLRVDTADAGVVAAGETPRVRTARADSLRLTWSPVPPTTGGQPRGRHLAVDRVVTFARRPLAVATTQATAVSADTAVFQPLVTNASGVPLRIVVNAGLVSGGRALADDCRCVVPPGATSFSVGFHALLGNSTVRAIAPDGRTATFEHLGASVDRRSGVVRLRFNEVDVR